MNYFNIRAISNTSLGKINPEQGGSPLFFKAFMDGTFKEDSTPSFSNGDIIHKGILEPELIAVAAEKPTALLGLFIDNLVELEKGKPLSILSDEQDLLEAKRLTGYKIPVAQILKKLETPIAQEYLKFKKSCGDKIAITAKERILLDNCINSISHSERARDLIVAKHPKNSFEELEIFWDYKGVKCKSKIDKLWVDWENRTFTLVDLKSTSKSIDGFKSSFEYYRYYRQMAFYIQAIKERLLEETGEEFKLNECYIVAVATTRLNEVRIYQIHQEYLDKGKLEWQSLIDRYIHHKESEQWIFPIEYSENQVYLLKPEIK